MQYAVDIGRAAGILVDIHPKTGKRKFATVRDLRRGFLTRWSSKVTPAVLKVLGRHDAIETTMKHYVTRDAISIGGQLWALEEKTASEGVSDGYQTPSDAAAGDPLGDQWTAFQDVAQPQ